MHPARAPGEHALELRSVTVLGRPEQPVGGPSASARRPRLARSCAGSPGSVGAREPLDLDPEPGAGRVPVPGGRDGVEAVVDQRSRDPAFGELARGSAR